MTADKTENVPHANVVDALRNMTKLNIPMEAALVTQKNEIGFGTRGADAELAESLLRDAGIPFKWCDLRPEHFLPIDAHPTSEGYDHLIDCIAPELNKITNF